MDAPSDNTPAIEFRNVSLAFGDVLALDDVSFVLERGQMIVITGVSGSGKSVLLHLAIGLITPAGGAVVVDGRHIEAMDEDELLDLRSKSMGIVFQESALFTSMTVFQNTAFRLAEHGWSASETERAVLEILRFVGLEEHIHKLPEELSIGMGRRLEIARALVGWPSVMLFDEPTSGLDPINAKQVMDLVIRARDVHGISSLYVTKEIHEIPYLLGHRAVGADSSVSIVAGSPAGPVAPQVIVLDGGKIVFIGSADEFLASEIPAVRQLVAPKSNIPIVGTADVRRPAR